MNHIEEFDTSEEEEPTTKPTTLYSLFQDEEYPANKEELAEHKWGGLVFD